MMTSSGDLQRWEADAGEAGIGGGSRRQERTPALGDAGALQSGRWGSNPRPSAWEADALPTELRPRAPIVAPARPGESLVFRFVDADAVEIRVLGCLIEKQRTTPDAYPLSLNSLRLACNQATARDPVVAYEEREIKAALDRMSNRGWTRFASGASSRALKYRHLLDEALELSGPELSLLGVLMLRGAQTVGELKQRSERLHRFESIPEG